MVLEKQSLCYVTSSCSSTNEGAEAAEGAAECRAQRQLLKRTLHAIHVASPATQRNKWQKERTCVAKFSSMISGGRRQLPVQKVEIHPCSETMGRKKDLELNLTAC